MLVVGLPLLAAAVDIFEILAGVLDRRLCALLFAPDTLGFGVEPVGVLFDADCGIEIDLPVAEIDRDRPLRLVDTGDRFGRLNSAFCACLKPLFTLGPRSSLFPGVADCGNDLVDEIVVPVE